MSDREKTSEYFMRLSAEAIKSKMTGAERIAVERQRQIEIEGWTTEHDAQHDNFELWDAARAYMAAARWATFDYLTQPMPAQERDNQAFWPWEESWWKPSDDPIRNLEKAGALIAAQIDRLAVSDE